MRVSEYLSPNGPSDAIALSANDEMVHLAYS